ncbi:MAG: FecR domain-containing protein [Deltaproteobacteria bacterium]|nr:FecR domain-containing protein [Deltaproteobacteria bacterium]
MRLLTTTSLLLCLGFVACVPLGLRDAAPLPAVLQPQVSRVIGEAYLQPRHNRERGPLTGRILLEPGDWVETGATGKVEILLPAATVRLYRHTRVQVPFAFEGRVAVSRELQVEGGEALVDIVGPGGFTVRTSGLEVEVRASPATLLVGSRAGVHEAACYRGRAEARNIRVRGQTVIRLEEGHRLTLDDAATLAFLRSEKLPDEWRRWERPTTLLAGLVPAPLPPAPEPPAPAVAPPAPAVPEPAPEPPPQPIVEQPLPNPPTETKTPQ